MSIPSSVTNSLVNMPFFSVVIPALDEQKLLPLLLDDLAKQTYQSFEVIVVDGGSKDKTVSIAEEFVSSHSTSFRVLSSQLKNVSLQRNLGAESATGEFLVFLDADSRIPSYFLEGIHYSLMKEMVDGWTNLTETTSKYADVEMYANWQNLALEGSALLKSPIAVGASMGVRRSAFEKIKGFDASIAFGEDSDLAQRLVKAGYTFAAIKEPRYKFNMRRYHKEGTLSLMVRLLPTYVNHLLGEKIHEASDVYPMNGGSYYKKSQKKTLLRMQSFQKVFKKILKSRRKSITEIADELRARVRSLSAE